MGWIRIRNWKWIRNKSFQISPVLAVIWPNVLVPKTRRSLPTAPTSGPNMSARMRATNRDLWSHCRILAFFYTETI